MFGPTERWFWRYCPEKDRLVLEISEDAQFCSPFGAAQLRTLPDHQALSVNEAAQFWEIDSSLLRLELPFELRLECCLMALCEPFLQVRGHKSWYFQENHASNVQVYDVVMLKGLTSQYALVVSMMDDSATCLMLGDIDTLAGKVVPRFQFVRVLKNRVFSLDSTQSYRYSA